MFYVISFLLFIYTLSNFKKGLFLFLGLKYILVPNITVVSIPQLPLLSLDNFLTIVFFLLFINSKYRNNPSCFPWKVPFIFLSSTWFICSFFSAAGFFSEISRLISNFLYEIIIIWMIWNAIESKRDFQQIYNIISIVTFFSCLYGIYEHFLQNNSYQLYAASYNFDPSRIVLAEYDSDSLRGYRVNSFFSHPIGAGINWALFVIWSAILYTWSNEKFVRTPFVFCTCLLCLIGIVLTKMRAGYFFLLIGLFGCINIKSYRFYLILLFCCLGIISFFSFSSKNFSLFLSIFTGDRFDGSNLELRIDQFKAAFELLKENPICGLGQKFYTVYSNEYTRRLWGLESIWLKAIVEYGILGVFAYLFLIFYSVVLIPRKYKCFLASIVAMAFWLTYSLTSIPGTHIYLYYLVLIYCIKKSCKYVKFVKYHNMYKINYSHKNPQVNDVPKDN